MTLNVAAEGQRSENHVALNHQPADIISNNSSISRTQTDGGWLSSPTVEDSKCGPAWPLFSGYPTAASSKPKNDSMLDHVETRKKTLIFGVDFSSHRRSSLSVEKLPPQPISVFTGATEGQVSTSLEAESDQKSDVSKASKESKAQFQVSLKETQSKQSSSASTRSRIKVLTVICFWSSFLICIFFNYLYVDFFNKFLIYGMPTGSNAGDSCWPSSGLNNAGRV